MIPTITSKKQYNCDGSQTVFSFDFKIFSKTDIVVILTDSDGIESILTYITDYTVSATNNDFSQGGDVTTVATYASGNKITVMRVIDFKQETDYENNEKFDAAAFENDLDRAACRDQQLQEQFDRVIHTPRSDETADLEIPAKDARAGNFLAFNDEGEPIAAEAVSSAPVTNFMKTVLDDETAVLARATLGVHSLADSHKTVSRIIASTDSDSEYQNRADTVIDTDDDAGAAINTILSTVNGMGGGIVLVLPGTYNIETTITPANYVTLMGMGFGTLFKRMAAIQYVIDVSGSSYCTLKDFQIDGNKSSFSGGIYIGIYANLNYTNNNQNIISHDNDDYGFYKCCFLTNCYAYGNTSGISQCRQINNGYSYNNSEYGFDTCFNVCACFSYSNIKSGYYNNNQITACEATGNLENGFQTCVNVSSCWAYQNHNDGFLGGRYISGCNAEDNTNIGFNGAYHLSNCLASSNDLHGFSGCVGITNCFATNNTGYGYSTCTACGHNRSTFNTAGNYNTCYADYAGSVAVADTAAGGWNG